MCNVVFWLFIVFLYKINLIKILVKIDFKYFIRNFLGYISDFSKGI